MKFRTEADTEYSYVFICLRRIREQKKLNQDVVCNALTCSQGHVSKYESGRRVLTAPDLIKILNAFGIQPSVFFHCIRASIKTNGELDYSNFDNMIKKGHHVIGSQIEPMNTIYLRLNSTGIQIDKSKVDEIVLDSLINVDRSFRLVQQSTDWVIDSEFFQRTVGKIEMVISLHLSAAVGNDVILTKLDEIRNTILSQKGEKFGRQFPETLL